MSGLAVTLTATAMRSRAGGGIYTPSDFCPCAFACAFEEKAFAGVGARENDYSSFIFQKMRPADTIALELHKEGRKVVDLNSNAFGRYYPTFAAQPLYVGYVLEWGAVWAAHGGGLFTVVARKNILGAASVEESRKFRLNWFDEFTANGTVRVEFTRDSNVIASPFDFTGLVAGGWPSSYRLPAQFGNRRPTVATDSYESSDRTRLSVQPSVSYEYSLRTRLLPSYIADVLSADVPLSDGVLISDYNLASPRMFDRLPVFPVSVELTTEAGAQEVYECVFTDAKNDILRQY